MSASRPDSSREQLLQAALAYFARHGVHNQSLRSLASAIGTSHRMLNYHFGSREGLLAEVVAAVERRQRETFAALAGTGGSASLRETAQLFWTRVVAETLTYGPLLFELSVHAMQGENHAADLRNTLITPWLDVLEASLLRNGFAPETARIRARLALAAVNGLLFDLLLTGDRKGVDEAHGLLLELLGVDDHGADEDKPRDVAH